MSQVENSSIAQRVLRILQVTQAHWFSKPIAAVQMGAAAATALTLSRSSVMFRNATRNAAAVLREAPRLVSSRVWSRQRAEASILLR